MYKRIWEVKSQTMKEALTTGFRPAFQGDKRSAQWAMHFAMESCPFYRWLGWNAWIERICSLRFTVLLSSWKFYFSLMSLMAFLTTGILVAGGGPSSINSSGSLQNNKITVQKRLKVHQRKSNGEGVGETGHQMMLWTESIGFNGSSNL